MPPAQAAAILIAPSFVTNVWQALTGRSLLALLRRFGVMLAGVVIGIWTGAGLLTGANTKLAVTGLGLALVLYALSGLASLKITVPPRAEPWLSPLMGIITGLVTGATGVFVIPAVPYLQALEMERDDLIQALGIFFLTATISLAFVLWQAGIFQGGGVAWTSVLAILPAFIGMWAGQKVRDLIKPGVFRLCFFVGMLLLGLHLAARAFV